LGGNFALVGHEVSHRFFSAISSTGRHEHRLFPRYLV
jgi:hypothetical protein